MISKEVFTENAVVNQEEEEFVIRLHSDVFDKKVDLKVVPEEEEDTDDENGITDRIIDIANDLLSLEAIHLESIQEIVWKCFNGNSKIWSYASFEDQKKYETGEMTPQEYLELNKKGQQELYEIYDRQSCWDKIGEPEYRTCLYPSIWNHRFGFITFYPEWEENGLNILLRNGKIIGYVKGSDPITSGIDDPNVQSVYGNETYS